MILKDSSQQHIPAGLTPDDDVHFIKASHIIPLGVSTHNLRAMGPLPRPRFSGLGPYNFATFSGAWPGGEPVVQRAGAAYDA